MRRAALLVLLSTFAHGQARDGCGEELRGTKVKVYRSARQLPARARASLADAGVDFAREALAGPAVCPKCLVAVETPGALERCGLRVRVSPRPVRVPCGPCQGVGTVRVPELGGQELPVGTAQVTLYRVPADAGSAELMMVPVESEQCPPCLAP